MAFVPYTLGTDPKFEKCLPDTLKEEGGYSNDAHDPGGMTMEGIIQREYDAKRTAWGLPTQWVRNISTDEMRTIYYTDYWMPYCPLMPAGLDLQLFDMNVNAGPHRSIVLLQRALAVDDDGQIGPITLGAIKTFVTRDQIETLIDNFMLQREAFYRSLSTFQYFGSDWIGRSVRIDAEAKAMA